MGGVAYGGRTVWFWQRAYWAEKKRVRAMRRAGQVRTRSESRRLAQYPPLPKAEWDRLHPGLRLRARAAREVPARPVRSRGVRSRGVR